MIFLVKRVNAARLAALLERIREERVLGSPGEAMLWLLRNYPFKKPERTGTNGEGLPASGEVTRRDGA